MEEFQEKVSSFLVDHSKQIVIVAVAAFVIGGTLTVYNSLRDGSERKIQEKFALTERKYSDVKSKFLQAKNQADAKAKDVETKKDAKKADDKTKEPVLVVATGDLDKDYGTVVGEFEAVLTESPSSQAAKMAALNLSEIYADYNKGAQAIAALQKVPHKDSKNDLIGALVLHRLASLEADQGQCPQAREKWGRLLNTAPAFLKKEVRLRTALCFEQEGQSDQAKQLLTEISLDRGEGSDLAVSKDAEKYLRYFNFKKLKTQVGQNN